MALDLVGELQRHATDDLGWSGAKQADMLDAYCYGTVYTGSITDPETGEETPVSKTAWVNLDLRNYIQAMINSGQHKLDHDEVVVTEWILE